MSPKKHINVFDHIFPNLEDWPIYKLSEDRTAFVAEVRKQVEQRFLEKGIDQVEQILAKTIYQERIRTKERPWKVDPPDDKTFWRKTKKEFAAVYGPNHTEGEREANVEAILSRITHRYAEEIVGTFRIGTFRFMRKFLTVLFNRLLNTAAGRNFRRLFGGKHRLYQKLKVDGHIELVRSLINKGTVVVVPTHFSNLDSIIIGYVLDGVMGLPAFTYGAGLNLYNSGFAAYFMNRLGAYRVDRRKKNPIYLETLKMVSNLGIQKGVHSLFFPGGTRARSGAMEEKLKLGLLGTTVEAQRSMCLEGRREKVFIVPLVVSYHFVLEAKFLIEQYLRSTGKEQYIRSRDHSFSIRKVTRFIWQFFSESSEIMFSVGRPFDVTGNFVDENGVSIDKLGRQVNLDEFFMTNGVITEDLQRESVYTKNLAEKIIDRFKKENIVLSSHIAAFVCFRLMRNLEPDLSLYEWLRLPTEDYGISFEKVCAYGAQAVDVLKDMEKQGLLKLSDQFELPIDALMKDGIRKLGVYHVQNPLKLEKDGQVVSRHFNMLYFYHNRLMGYEIETKIKWNG